jgi:predicted lipoprotein with Yx(FWY)xxD motif
MKVPALMQLRRTLHERLLGLAGWLLVMAATVPPVLAAQVTPNEMTVPGDFSIDVPAPGKLDVRTSPQNLPIYVFDDDMPGKSNCNAGCIGPWTPVVATSGSKPFGDWTIIEREDHRQQWAYKKHPLYTYFNDTPGKPTGDEQDGKWHLFQP